MIITGGENIASREVEDTLYTDPGVAEVAVFRVSHPYWIEAVAGAVVVKPGVEVTVAALGDRARERLAGFKMPKYVVLVDELPKNPSGRF